MIHMFTMHGRNIVLDVGSGAVHAVDGPIRDILQRRHEHPEDDPREVLSSVYPIHDIEEALDEIQALTEQGVLFADEGGNTVSMHMKERKPVVKALCLHIAHACNLRCAYCFAGQGVYGGSRSLMSLDIGKKAIDFLIGHSGGRRNLEVDFFGGEPMLNFDTVKGIVSYARSREQDSGKHFRFTLTTNGTLLNDESMAYINEHMDNVVLSIDGRKAVNDRMRPFPDGSGSYDTIRPRLKRMAESRRHERYYVRGTYTGENTDFCEDVLHLADEGFTQISVEPAVTGSSVPFAIKPEDLPILCGQYERLATELLTREREGRPFRFFHFDIDLEGGPCMAKRVTGCGAGTEYLAVTPEGELFPCHQFVGEQGFCIGNLDAGVTNKALCESFAQCHVYAKPECVRCWAKYYCSGGCAANAFHTHGDILQPDDIGCALQRKRIECALYLFVERALTD